MKIDTEFWQKKRVLVTGHTGFKGAWLTALLNHLGAQTAGVSLLPPDDQPSLYKSGIRPTEVDRIADIRDPLVANDVISSFQPEIVFHLAAQALVLPSYKDPVGTFATNVLGTAHILDASIRCDSVKVVMNITSDKCYENREWHWPYRETDPMGGHDPYSASKGCAEIVAASFRRSYFQQKKIALPSVRAGNVIGGGDWSESRIIPDLARSFSQGKIAAIRNPYAVRPWQHVLEPLRAYIQIAQAGWDEPQKASRGWNVGPDTDSAQPVLELTKKAAHYWGESAKYEIVDSPNKPHEATYLKLDTSLIRAEIGWRPILDFEASLAWTIDWYKRYYSGESVVDLCQTQLHKCLHLEDCAQDET